MRSNKKLICTVHAEISELGEELKKLDVSTPKGSRRVKTIGKLIVKLAEQARKKGQSMEDRLVEYYNAVEELGFKRKVKKS